MRVPKLLSPFQYLTTPLYYYPLLQPIPNSIIQRVSYKKIGSNYEVLSYLNQSLIPDKIKNRNHELKIYGSCDGTGTDSRLLQATYRSLSESLERWAFYSHLDTQYFGFDLDSSTNGMSAYPRPFASLAREHALSEILERTTQAYWWHHTLPAQSLTSTLGADSGISILCPFDLEPYHLVILWKTISQQQRVYGFAARRNVEAAKKAALVELNRNAYLLDRYFLTHAQLAKDSFGLTERRLLFFASLDGQKYFDHKVNLSLNLFDNLSKTPQLNTIIPILAWKPLIDTSIPGPWSKYAVIWRILLNQPVIDDSTRDDIFLF